MVEYYLTYIIWAKYFNSAYHSEATLLPDAFQRENRSEDCYFLEDNFG